MSGPIAQLFNKHLNGGNNDEKQVFNFGGKPKYIQDEENAPADIARFHDVEASAGKPKAMKAALNAGRRQVLKDEPWYKTTGRMLGAGGMGTLKGGSQVGADVADLVMAPYDYVAGRLDPNYKYDPWNKGAFPRAREIASTFDATTQGLHDTLGLKDTTAEKVVGGMAELVPSILISGGATETGLIPKVKEAGTAIERGMGGNIIGKIDNAVIRSSPDMVNTWLMNEAPKPEDQRTSLPEWGAQWIGTELGLRGLGAAGRGITKRLGNNPLVDNAIPADPGAYEDVFGAGPAAQTAARSGPNLNPFTAKSATPFQRMQMDWNAPAKGDYAPEVKNPYAPTIGRSVDAASLPDHYPLPNTPAMLRQLDDAKQLPALTGNKLTALPRPGEVVNWNYGTGKVDPQYQLRQLAKLQKEAVQQAQIGNHDNLGGNLQFKRAQQPPEIQELNQGLQKRLGPFTFGKGVEHAPEAMSNPEFQAANELSKIISGREVVPFKGSEDIHGANVRDRIYLNANTRQPVAYVTAHELAHSIETTSPETFSKLHQIVREHAADSEGLRAHYEKLGYKAEDLPKELTADAMAESMLENSFWARVRQQAPEILKPMLDALDNIIAKITRRPGNGMTIAPYLKDIETMRTRLANEYGSYLADMKAGKVRPLEEVAAKREMPQYRTQSGAPIEQAHPEEFIVKPDGTSKFGEISPEDGKEMRRQPGEIRLQVGAQSPKSRYGLIHINETRANEIRKLGYSDIPGFIEDTTSGYDRVYQGEGKALLLVKTDQPNKLCVVELMPDSGGGEDFYSVLSAFPARESYFNNKELLLQRNEPSVTVPTTDSSLRTSHQYSGGEHPIVQGRSSSDDSIKPDTGEGKLKFKQGEGAAKSDLSSMILEGARSQGKVAYGKWADQLGEKFPDLTDQQIAWVWHRAQELRKTGKLDLPNQGVSLTRADLAGGPNLVGAKNAQAETPPLQTLEGQTLLESMGIDPAKLKDIAGINIHFRDMWRNAKQVFGDKFPEFKARFLDPLDNAKEAWIDHQRALTNELKTEIVDRLGIKKGSRDSELVQLYGEGGYHFYDAAPKNAMTSEPARTRWIAGLEKQYGRGNIEWTGDGADILKPFTETDLVKEVGAKRAADIVEAENWFRQKYDDLIDQVNQVRGQIYPGQAEKQVPKRQDYFRHFREMEGLEGIKNMFDTPAQISPELAGKSMFTRPKTKWQGFMQRRGMGAYTPDAVGGFLNYAPSATYAIHIDPQGANFRALENQLAKSMGDNPGINNFLTYLKYFADDVQGKTNPWDRSAQEVAGRKVFRVLDSLNSRIKSNMILGNAGTMVSQVFNMPQGIAFTKQYAGTGLKRYLTSLAEKAKDPAAFAENNPMAQSQFLKERFSGDMYRRFETKLGKKVKNTAVVSMEDVDRFATEFIWNACYEKGINTKGGANPIRYADYNTRNLVAGRGIGEVPIGQKSKLFQLIAPFQVEVGNLWHVMNDMKNAKDWGGLLVALPLTLWLFNRGAEQIKGNSVALDPMQAVIDSVKIATDDNDNKAYRIMGRLAGEVLSNIPLGQTLSAALPFTDSQRKEFFGREDPTRFGSSVLVAKGLQDPLYKIAPSWGGYQAEKTMKGIKALSDRGVFNKSGNLQYPVNADAGNVVRSLAFGPTGTRESSDYYNNNGRPLSEKQTEQYQQDLRSGLSPEFSYNQFVETRRLNKLKNEEKKKSGSRRSGSKVNIKPNLRPHI